MTQKERIYQLVETLGSPKENIQLFKAPGRVNLIGEHTDYNNCPVFPFAADREILAACRFRNDNQVLVRDLQSSFGSIEFSIETEISPFPTGNWGNYIKAGVQGMVSLWPGLNPVSHRMSGFEMVIDSSIPPAAGMSSSSALVVLASLVFLAANGIEVDSWEDRLSLADACAKSERYTGTQGGGMDQAAILLGKQGQATKIDFNPLTCHEAPLPPDYALVVAHSTVSAPKTQSVMDAYNRRSIECRLAAAVVAKRAKDLYGITSIGYIGDLTPAKTGLTEMELHELVDAAVSERPYSVEDLAVALGLSAREVVTKWCIRKDGSVFPEPVDGFLLYKRLTHVLTEWSRVEQAYTALHQGDMFTLGTLMNQSHASCRDLHEISCHELNVLTDISREAGARGSRLTGAGFGGCTVNLVAKDRLDEFLAEVGRRFYREDRGLSSWEKWIFTVFPSSGAGRIKQENPAEDSPMV